MLLHHHAEVIKQKPAEALRNLASVFNSGICSDIVLSMYDETSKTHVIDIQSHILLLYLNSGYFRTHFDNTLFSNKMKPCEEKNRLCLLLPFDENIDKNLICLFFSLFYVTLFDAQHLNQEQRDKITHNILYLYQLAWRFDFYALSGYCEEQLFATMTIEYFGLLTEFCLSRDNETGRFSIKQHLVSLYSRLMQWYQCCIDHTEYSNLLTSTIIQPATTATTTTTTQQQQMADPAPKYGRKYLSCNKEEIMRDIMTLVDGIQQCQIPVKNHTLSANHMNTQIRYYRRICSDCLVNRSNSASSYQGYYYINFGSLTRYYSNGYESYAFRLKRKNSSTQLKPLVDNVLEMCLHRVYYPTIIKTAPPPAPRPANNNTNSNNSDLDMLVEEKLHDTSSEEQDYMIPEERYQYHGNQDEDSEEEDDEEEDEEDDEEEEEEIERPEELTKSRDQIERMDEANLLNQATYTCETVILLLSKKVCRDRIVTKYSDKNIKLATELSNFEIHSDKHCYQGKCDSCLAKRPVYIIQMEINLQRCDSMPPPPVSQSCSDIEMCK